MNDDSSFIEKSTGFLQKGDLVNAAMMLQLAAGEQEEQAKDYEQSICACDDDKHQRLIIFLKRQCLRAASQMYFRAGSLYKKEGERCCSEVVVCFGKAKSLCMDGEDVLKN